MTNSSVLKKVAQLDEQLFLTLFNGELSRYLRATALGVSKSGDGGLYLLGCVALWWLSETAQAQQVPLAILVGFLIERPIYFIAKHRFARVRPCDSLVNNAFIIPSDKFSLPSGHSAAAFVVAVILSRFNPELSVLWFSWASAVAASRVILGVHFPADIIIGALIGSICGACALLLVPV